MNMTRHPVRIPTDPSQPIDCPAWVTSLAPHDQWVVAACAKGHSQPWTRGGKFTAVCQECEKGDVPAKGHYKGACNRTACNQSPATWFNPAMAGGWAAEAHKDGKFYYCEGCAKMIGAHARGGGWRMVPPGYPQHPWADAD